MNEEIKSAAPVKEKGVPFFKLMAWSLRPGSTGVAMMILGYLTVFAVNTMKMPAALVGGLLLASKFVDGVTDLVAGYIVDRTNTKIGRGRPYELCLIGMWVTTVLMFCVPESATTLVKSIWILVMYLFANSIFYTFLNANSTVYMVRAFSSQKEYVQLSTYGGVVPMLIVLIFNVLFPTLMGTMATSQGGWIKLVMIFAVPLTVLGMLRFFVIKETHDVDVSAEGEKVDFKEVLLVLRKNRYIYILALASLVMNLLTNMGVGVFYFTEIVGNVGLMSVLALSQVVVLPLMFVFPQLLKKMSVAKLVRIGLLVGVLAGIVNFIAGSNMPLLILGAILTGASSVPVSMLGALLIIECADYNEHIGLRRMEGSLGAVNGFATKVGAGLGAGILGILIGLAGYDGKLAVQPASAITMIRLLYSLIPSAFDFAVYLVFRLYTLDKEIPQIRAENEARRAEAEAAAHES